MITIYIGWFIVLLVCAGIVGLLLILVIGDAVAVAIEEIKKRRRKDH